MDKDTPEAYELGNMPFLGLTIYLDSKPLIPRPETEWWTEKLIEERGGVIFGASPSDGEGHEKISSKKLFVPKNDSAELRVLDLCAGSGAIGCALLQHMPKATVYFGEIDPAHEATIRKNIRENGLDEGRADIRIGDLFTPFQGIQFDVIATNPPYVPAGRALDASVADFEPALALRAGARGLDVIRRIIKELPQYLTKGGEAWVECDVENIEEARALCERAGFTALVQNDQYGRPRIIVISW